MQSFHFSGQGSCEGTVTSSTVTTDSRGTEANQPKGMQVTLPYDLKKSQASNLAIPVNVCAFILLLYL
jgi:hypothetical protein